MHFAWKKTVIRKNLSTHSKNTKKQIVSFDEENGKFNNFAVQQAKRGRKFYSSKVIFSNPDQITFPRLKKANAIVINRKAKTIEQMTEEGISFHVRDFLKELKGHEKEERVRRAFLKVVERLRLGKLMEKKTK